MDFKSPGAPAQQMPDWLADLIPYGHEVRACMDAVIPGGKPNGPTRFDLGAPIFAALSRAYLKPGATAEVVALTFDHRGFKITARCPFCGENHHHGGGNPVVPLPMFGHRVADCGRGGYHLVVGGPKV